jgi:predicted nucleic acid-binding protein
MSRPEHRYWDAAVFLAIITAEKGRAEVCEEIVRMARNGETIIFTSSVSLVEVVRPGRKGSVRMDETKQDTITQFFRNSWIRIIDFHSSLAAHARELIWRFDLHVRDSIHIASAIHGGVAIDYIETYDDKWIKLDVTTLAGCPPIRNPKGKPLPLLDGSNPPSVV